MDKPPPRPDPYLAKTKSVVNNGSQYIPIEELKTKTQQKWLELSHIIYTKLRNFNEIARN